MMNQKASRFAQNYLLLIAKQIVRLISPINFLNDISSILQQKPNAYLLKPQYIFPQKHTTLLNIRKRSWYYYWTLIVIRTHENFFKQ